MKILSFIFLSCFLCVTAAAQTRLVGTVDFYGARTVSEQQLREALQIKEGDALQSNDGRGKIEKRLTALTNVEQADVSAICCTSDGRVMLYVGIREKGAPVLEFRVAPKGAVRLTDKIVKTGAELDEAREQAMLKGDFSEDVSQGHSLLNNAEARAVQSKFVSIAAQNLKLLRQVLRESADASHRALAAEIIAYAADKQLIVEDLVGGMKDSDTGVRNNSMRALGLIAGYAPSAPKKKISVPFAPFVDLLNSIEWTDRNKSSLALLNLTENRNAELLAELRERALTSLFNMARWKNKNYANTGFIILGRLGDLPEEEIVRAVIRNDWKDLLTGLQKNLKPQL